MTHISVLNELVSLIYLVQCRSPNTRRTIEMFAGKGMLAHSHPNYFTQKLTFLSSVGVVPNTHSRSSRTAICSHIQADTPLPKQTITRKRQCGPLEYATHLGRDPFEYPYCCLNATGVAGCDVSWICEAFGVVAVGF